MAEKRGKIRLHDLFMEGMEEIYDAEKRFMKCFAALIIAGGQDSLKRILTTHATIAEKHIAYLERLFNELNHKGRSGYCSLVSGLTGKASAMIRTVETGTALRDVAIIWLAQVIQHYKIASYGNLASLAIEMNYEHSRKLIEECLADEKEMDHVLTEIARGEVNPAAQKESQ